MSVKALRNQLLGAIAMVLVAAIALGSSTFAWFAINNTVTVTGMTVKTEVGNNLLISPDADEAHYGIALHQVVEGKLEPASTVTALNDSYYFTSTTNVDGSGDAKTDAYTLYVATGGSANYETFDMNYGANGTNDTADTLPYVDYAFYLKATNADAAEKKISMTKINLLYDGDTVTTGTAWRAAIFCKYIGTSSSETVDEVATANHKSTLGLSSSQYFSEVAHAGDYFAVNATAAEPDTAVSHYKDPATLATLAGQTTAYYKVTVRLWLEGEDTSCKNDVYAQLTRDWRLDLVIQITDSNGVAVIGTTPNAVTTDASTTSVTYALGDTLANGEKVASFAWKEISGSTISDATGTGVTSSTFVHDKSTPGTYYFFCEITTDKGNVYRTNTVPVVVAAAP